METQTKAPKPKKNRRAKIADARDTAFGGLQDNPLGVLVGGIAVGLVAGVLIPRSERERTALEPVGKRIAEGAVAAVAAAKETGKEQLSAAVLGRDAAKEGARKVFDSALGAAKGTGAKKTTEPA